MLSCSWEQKQTHCSMFTLRDTHTHTRICVLYVQKSEHAFAVLHFALMYCFRLCHLVSTFMAALSFSTCMAISSLFCHIVLFSNCVSWIKRSDLFSFNLLECKNIFLYKRKKNKRAEYLDRHCLVTWHMCINIVWHVLVRI